MDEVSQLKTILKNSFAGIKKDISDLKEKQDQALSSAHKLRQDVDAISDSYTPKDKFNLLKIKVGELNNTLKKIWDLDSSIKTLEENKTDQKEFEQRFDSLKQEISRQLSDLNANTNKKITEYTNQVNKHIEDVNNNSAKVFSRINEQMKTVVTKNQLKTLTNDLNKEFADIKKEVAELRKIKETITASELEKRTNMINARVDLLAKEVVKTNQNVAKAFTSDEAKDMAARINKEFSELKLAAAEINRLKRYVSMVESNSLQKNDFHKQVSSFNSEIDDARKEIRGLRETNLTKKEFEKEVSELNSDINSAKKEIKEIRNSAKGLAKYEDVEKQINRIESSMSRKVLDLEKEVLALKRFERRHEREAEEPKLERKEKKKLKKEEAKLRKEESKAEARNETGLRRPPEKPKKARSPMLALSIISIILIVLAFASLGSSIIAYFALEPVLTNYLTIGAVVFFIVGIITRAVVVKKRK